MFQSWSIHLLRGARHFLSFRKTWPHYGWCTTCRPQPAVLRPSFPSGVPPYSFFPTCVHGYQTRNQYWTGPICQESLHVLALRLKRFNYKQLLTSLNFTCNAVLCNTTFANTIVRFIRIYWFCKINMFISSTKKLWFLSLWYNELLLHWILYF